VCIEGIFKQGLECIASTRLSPAIMSSAVACLPRKKRKHSQGSTNSEELMQQRKTSTDSTEAEALMGSLASDDTAAMALRAFTDGGSIVGLNSPERKPLPPKKRKASFDSTFGDETKRKASFCFDDNRRRTMSLDSQAFENESAFGLIPLGSVTGSGGSVDDHLKINPSNDNISITSETHSRLPLMTSQALEHLDALGDDGASLELNKEEGKAKSDGEESSAATMASSNQRILLEALMGVTGGGGASHSFRRDRFESWGGMSDISMSGMGSENAAALAHSALYHTGLLEDLTAAADSAASSVSENEMIPSKISLTLMNRKFAIGGLSENFSGPKVNADAEVSSDIHAFVAAAMANVGDQLAGLAGAVEAAAEGSICGSITSEMLKADTESDGSSTTSTLPDIRLDEGGRPRSWSTSSRPISVDYDAVQAAVDAAESATAALDLAAIANMHSDASGRFRTDSMKKSARKLPLQKNRHSGDPWNSYPPLHPLPTNKFDMEAIRARARAAAGYIPPDGQPSVPPIKKRAKRPELTSTPQQTFSSLETPFKGTSHDACTPKPEPMLTPSSMYTPSTPASALSTTSKASSQKWDEMYECLVEFVEVRREIENKGASEKVKREWEWDGNVPTTYKSKDGKALGRWINNQRSAKHKGSLKPDREVKLVDAGLKWSVLSTNSWQDMMDELRVYVTERTKDGHEWDGNVPTNYRIKGPATPTPIPENENDDDKNLGRWINRQRSLYQAGKLRKDREEELENIGLKWSVLSTTSWQSMFDSLLEYVYERKAEDPNNEWDGNVPANHKTDDKPSKALGRWINRQRSAYMKHKLKKEFVDKLDAVGLKWAVHERRPYPYSTSSESVGPVGGQKPVESPSPATTPKPNLVLSSSLAVAREPVSASEIQTAMKVPITKPQSQVATPIMLIDSPVAATTTKPEAHTNPKLLTPMPPHPTAALNETGTLAAATVVKTTATSLSICQPEATSIKAASSGGGNRLIDDCDVAPE